MASEVSKRPVENDDDNATRRVPESQKKGFWSVAFVAAGYCICMSGLYTGAAIALGMSWKLAILSSILGNLILSVYGGAMGAAGAREGVASSMLARPCFGRDGSKVVGMLLAIVMLGWFAVQVGFFGSTMSALFPNAGFISSKYVAALWGGLLMMLTAYFGYKGLNILSYIAVPAIALLSIVGVVLAVRNAGGWGVVVNIKPTVPMTLGTAVVSIVGSFAGGASAQADITRYAKSEKVAWYGTIFGYMGANMFIILAGFLMTAATGISDLPVALLSMGLGAAALVILILAQWTTNDNNLYTASLGISNVMSVSKHKIVIITGVCATIAGSLGLADYFPTWLNILGVALPPVAGVIICDYYVLNKKHYDFGPGAKCCKVNVWAFASLLIAAVAGFTIKWGIASINSLVISFVIYYIFMMTFGKKNVGIIGEFVEE